LTRPAPFGIGLDDAASFYYFALAITAVAHLADAVFVASPFGAALRGAARPVAAHERARSRRLADPLDHLRVLGNSGARCRGSCFVYYNKYIHPRVALDHRLGGRPARGHRRGFRHARRPIVGAAIVMILKNYVSAYIERWNMLLGFVFVFIVIFMPEGVVPGVRRLARRLPRPGGVPGDAGPAAARAEEVLRRVTCHERRLARSDAR